MYQGLRKQRPAQLDALKELVKGWSEQARKPSFFIDVNDKNWQEVYKGLGGLCTQKQT